MKRFIRTSLICFITLTLLCAGAIIFGRAQPQPAILSDIQPCGDYRLCYLGIVLGKTSWDDGLKIINDNPDFIRTQDINRVQHMAPDYTTYLLSMGVDEHSTVGEITITFGDPSVPIGNFISLLGRPCYVASYGYGMEVDYPNLKFQVSSAGYSVTPTENLDGIDMLQSANKRCINPDSTGMISLRGWHGFGDYR